MVQPRGTHTTTCQATRYVHLPVMAFLVDVFDIKARNYSADSKYISVLYDPGKFNHIMLCLLS